MKKLNHRRRQVWLSAMVWLVINTRFVVKPEGVSNVFFGFFWLNWWGNENVGVERHQRGVKPPTPRQIELCLSYKNVFKLFFIRSVMAEKWVQTKIMKLSLSGDVLISLKSLTDQFTILLSGIHSTINLPFFNVTFSNNSLFPYVTNFALNTYS